MGSFPCAGQWPWPAHLLHSGGDQLATSTVTRNIRSLMPVVTQLSPAEHGEGRLSSALVPESRLIATSWQRLCYFHSQSFQWYLPSCSTSYSMALATLARRASFPDVGWKDPQTP